MVDRDRHHRSPPETASPAAFLPCRDPVPQRDTAPQAPAALPVSGRFLAETFSNSAGSRSYKLYVPGSYRGQAVPLVVMLHGCSQTADDLAIGTRMNECAEIRGFLVVYPVQTAAANHAKCWNWFRPDDQRRDRGEPSLIAGITRQVMSDYVIDRRRVYIAGLSAGGAAAAIMGMAYPDLYAAIGVHSGLACGAASGIFSAFAAMQRGEPVVGRRPNGSAEVSETRRTIPTIVFHGDRDRTVHPANADRVIAQAQAATVLGKTLQTGQVDDGHAYSRTRHFDDAGVAVLEQWVVHGLGHVWSGGDAVVAYMDPRGPDATREMARFFLAHALPG
ncbi:MAG: PHB depolymerase family esterase [Azospirillum sp.]|nr:PHB depolymerase family esterase [Azospirillum sp.]